MAFVGKKHPIVYILKAKLSMDQAILELFMKKCKILFYSGIFYSCQFTRSFRLFHSFWEEDDLSR